MRSIESPRRIELGAARHTDSRDVFRAVSETNTGRGREVASAAASVTTGAVVDIATPVCVSQTTPALVNE